MDLPPGLEAAWGLRDHPRKGPKPGLTLHKIVAAAIRVADRDGLDAVSMARVAAELGAAPMSLYRHVTSKDELLDLMTDTAWGPPPDPVEGDWRDKLSAWAWAMRTSMFRHPWALKVPVSGLPVYPNNVAWFEQGLAALEGKPLAEAQKASVVLLVSGYVRIEVSTSADIAAAMGAESEEDAEQAWMLKYRDMMAAITDPVRFPATTRLLKSGVFDTADPPDDEFSFGLERILDGIAVLIGARSGKPG